MAHVLPSRLSTGHSCEASVMGRSSVRSASPTLPDVTCSVTESITPLNSQSWSVKSCRSRPVFANAASASSRLLWLPAASAMAVSTAKSCTTACFTARETLCDSLKSREKSLSRWRARSSRKRKSRSFSSLSAASVCGCRARRCVASSIDALFFSRTSVPALCTGTCCACFSPNWMNWNHGGVSASSLALKKSGASTSTTAALRCDRRSERCGAGRREMRRASW
mmetsp:Transcript_11464/g.27769  ORF Transcript_11464/g.27769 Transcript_11464/m.27769 type:complete len:224 (-) Transcript_11464:31-702(-)